MCPRTRSDRLQVGGQGDEVEQREAAGGRGEPIADVVLERAIEEFAAVGMAALRVDQVARAAEVNKTSVYRRWPTREGAGGRGSGAGPRRALARAPGHRVAPG